MAKKIKEFQLQHGLKADGILGKITIAKMIQVFGIKTNAQMAHFLANVAHETGGFNADTENLNYSAKTLAATWPKRFITKGQPNALALTLERNPEKIANSVYANRMGNGNELSGEGWKYRGRGALQLTGKNNYALFSKFVKDPEIMENPELVATKYFWESALFYFTRNGLWNKMNATGPLDVRAIRYAVNGGYIGVASVQEKFKYYYNLLKK